MKLENVAAEGRRRRRRCCCGRRNRARRGKKGAKGRNSERSAHEHCTLKLNFLDRRVSDGQHESAGSRDAGRPCGSRRSCFFGGTGSRETRRAYAAPGIPARVGIDSINLAPGNDVRTPRASVVGEDQS